MEQLNASQAANISKNCAKVHEIVDRGKTNVWIAFLTNCWKPTVSISRLWISICRNYRLKLCLECFKISFLFLWNRITWFTNRNMFAVIWLLTYLIFNVFFTCNINNLFMMILFWQDINFITKSTFLISKIVSSDSKRFKKHFNFFL